VAAAKALARSLGPAIDDETIDRTANLLADTWETPDAQEGIAVFFDKSWTCCVVSRKGETGRTPSD